MKFLLVFTMLVGSAFANAQPNEGWAVKCFEKDRHDFDLAYIIKVEKDVMRAFNYDLQLLDCTRGGHTETDKANCRERGELKKIERQDETCLVLKRHDSITNDKFSLCYQEQETFNPRRLVPVTVTDDRQESRIYCEKEILRLL